MRIYFDMRISDSQLVWNICIALFAGIVALAGLAAFAGSNSICWHVFTHFRCLNAIISLYIYRLLEWPSNVEG